MFEVLTASDLGKIFQQTQWYKDKDNVIKVLIHYFGKTRQSGDRLREILKVIAESEA